MRQVVLDTETTGLEIQQGHRILELGGVEILDRKLTRRHYHQYVNPEREVEEGALEVHGITNHFLQNKPVFADVLKEFLDFVRGSELIIHNAAFDVNFLNHEMSLADESLGTLQDYCSVVDSLQIARKKHPGQRNSLDALCRRYNVDSSKRELHGALLDAEILADVYLLLTGGQVDLLLDQSDGADEAASEIVRLDPNRARLPVVMPSEEELATHEARIVALDAVCESGAVWRRATSG